MVISTSIRLLSQLALLVFSFHVSVQFQTSTFGLRRPLHNSNSSFGITLADDPDNNASQPPPSNNKKKSKKIVLNPNLIGVNTISSDGILTEQKEQQKEAQISRDSVQSNLGVATKKKKGKSDSTTGTNKKLSAKAQKLMDQRTANGAVDGRLMAGLALPEDQPIQVQEMKRGNKQVTIVR